MGKMNTNPKVPTPATIVSLTQGQVDQLGSLQSRVCRVADALQGIGSALLESERGDQGDDTNRLGSSLHIITEELMRIYEGFDAVLAKPKAAPEKRRPEWVYRSIGHA